MCLPFWLICLSAMIFTCLESQFLLYTGVFVIHQQQPLALPFLFLCVLCIFDSEWGKWIEKVCEKIMCKTLV